MTRKYDQTQTPYQRVLAAPSVLPAVKQQLRGQFLALDPVYLLTTIIQLQDQLWQQACLKPEGMRPPLSAATLLPLQSQPETATNGQSSQNQPGLSLKDYGTIRTSQKQYPGKFPDNQLRTFQRRVKTWRVMMSSRKIELEQARKTPIAEGTHLLSG